MIQVEVASDAKTAYAGWSVGLLELEGLLPRTESPELLAEVERIEAAMKTRYGGMSRKELAAAEEARPYTDHFSRSGKAYPVLLQAEAVATKGRRLSMPDSLVLAMFAAELESMILTAGHDAAALGDSVTLYVASGDEAMPTLGGAEKLPPRGDLVMRDSRGIVASVLIGPDARTPIGANTERLLFVAYAPPEVGADRVEAHFDRLAALCGLACPELGQHGRRLARL
jgi:DNA/RNA-binding domain of Phe-tRNA-synthetase-like protein